MSLKKIQQVKKDRGFALFDLIIYGVLIAVVAALFVVVFTAFNREPLTGVRVSVRAEAVFEFTFGGQLSVLSEDVTYDEDSKGITVTVQSDDGFNVIYIDKQNRSVKMLFFKSGCSENRIFSIFFTNVVNSLFQLALPDIKVPIQ